MRPQVRLRRMKPQTRVQVMRPQREVRRMRPQRRVQRMRPQTKGQGMRPQRGVRRMRQQTRVRRMRPQTRVRRVRPETRVRISLLTASDGRQLTLSKGKALGELQYNMQQQLLTCGRTVPASTKLSTFGLAMPFLTITAHEYPLLQAQEEFCSCGDPSETSKEVNL